MTWKKHARSSGNFKMLNVDRILAKIRSKDCKSVGLQFPEGLRKEMLRLADTLQSENIEVVLVGETCYGACDLVQVPVDILIHFGHAPIKTDENVIYEEVRLDSDLKVLDKCLPLLKSPVGLITNVQHVHQLLDVKKYLEGKGLEVIIGKGDDRIKYSGQILGCDFSAATAVKDRVSCYLYLGTGDFHPLGVALGTNKDVISANPFTGEVKNMNELKDKFIRQRFAAIELTSKASRFGILVSKKFGQMRLGLAREIAKELNDKGKKAYVFYSNDIIPDNFEGYDIDAFVSTACPRIAVDDYLKFKNPIVNPKELEIVLKNRKWEDYEFDEIV